jgi:hypothetical protein
VDKKSVSDWKNDVIDWLAEHESAYADAMRYIDKPADYDPYDDGGLTDSDFEKLVGWIYDHDQVREDYERKFGKFADAERAVVKQKANSAKANESATLKRIEELCEQYERGNAYQREDSEIEVGINETGTFYTVSDYSESRGGSEYLQNLVPVKGVSKDAVRKLCDKHGWYITF